MSNAETPTIEKCQCGHPICRQYTLSTQGGVGFSLEDAQLYAAAGELLESLETLLSWVKAWDCDFVMDDEWPADEAKILAAIAKARGEVA